MIKKRQLQKMVPFVLSAFWVLWALWVELTPSIPGTTSSIIHNYFKQLDFLAYDVKIKLMARATHFKPNPIIIVAIDNKSIQNEGGWPWSYDKYARLIQQVRDMGVSVIASDLVLNESEQNTLSAVKAQLLKMDSSHAELFRELDKFETKFDGNAALIQQIQNKNDIVLPFLLFSTDYTQGQLPDPIALLSQHDLKNLALLNMPGYITNFIDLQKASLHNGFISTLTDEDGVIRRTPLVLRYQEKLYPSLPLAVAAIYMPKHAIQLNIKKIAGAQYLESVQFGNQKIPTGKAGRVLIPFHGMAYSFPYYSATDVIHHQLKPEALKNAIVLIGVTATGGGGFVNTSVDTAMPSIEIHANVLSGILDNQFPYLPYWAKAATIGLVLIIWVTLAFLLPLLRPAFSILLASGVVISLIMVDVLLWVAERIVFSFSVPMVMTILLVLTSMAYGFLFENRKKRFLRDVFGKYVPPDYLKILLDNPDEYSLDGESAELTVLFADIRHFTTLAEGLDATRVKKLLNQYFTPMTAIVFKHGGTIDKYVGDMMMAFWGAPIKNLQHRVADIDAALDMLAQSEALKNAFIAEGLPEVDIGIGINTGLMNVGDMGSDFRRSYTVVGDPVNLAERLESATKYYGVRLIVGSATREGQTQFLFRLLDKVKVKGKHLAVEIYEVICRTNEATPALLQEVAAHEEAMAAYFKADWSRAVALFQSLSNQHPDAVLYSLLLTRIEYFKQNPPSPGWDGAYQWGDK